MRITIDSARYDAISGYNWPYKIGHYNGRECWTHEQIAEASARGELLALVDILGTAPYAAAILHWDHREFLLGPDFEVLREWVQARNAFQGDAVIYCTRESLTTVINALQDEPCLIWLAEPTDSHEPPRQPPPLGLPASLRLLGIQYALAPDSGGAYNISIFYDDTWHPMPGAPIETLTPAGPDPVMIEAGLARAPLTAGEQNLANLEAHWERQEAGAIPGKAPATTPSSSIAAAPVAAAQAASATLETGQNMVNPDPGPSPSPPGAASTSASSAPPRPVPATALSRPPAAAPAPSSSSPARPSTQPSGFQVPPGLLQQPGPTAGAAAPAPPAPATSSDAGTGASDAPAIASAVHDLIGTTMSATPPIMQLLKLGGGPPSTAPAVPAPATGPPASQLPHSYIAHVLDGVRDVAELFHQAGVHQVAMLLEQGAAAATETGSLLERAGL